MATKLCLAMLVACSFILHETIAQDVCVADRVCTADCSLMADATGCSKCFCFKDCRSFGCPKGYDCLQTAFASLPQFTCVQRLKCPPIKNPLFATANACVGCKTDCNCMVCKPGYLCCPDFYGCVSCRQGIPF